jgi:hypothetical protein
MNTSNIPEVFDLKGIVADYLDAYFPEHRHNGQREQIIQRCTLVFVQLMSLLQDVYETGRADETLFIAFMRDLASATGQQPTDNTNILARRFALMLH